MPRFRLHAFAVLALFGWGAAPAAAACCLFPGWGSWGVFRPLTWTGYYGAAPVCCPPACGGISACVGCCPGGTCPGGACPGGCPVQTYYGPVGSSACCVPSGVICCDGAGCANCCVQYSPSSNEPIPDSNISNKGSGDQLRPDDFRGTPGGTGSSSDWQSRDRSTSPADRSGDYLGEPRSIEDRPPSPRSSIPPGGDAPPFTPPTQSPAAPPNQSPAPINNEEGIRFNRVEPLPDAGPVALTYRASRQRVRLSLPEAASPPAVARREAEVNADRRAVPRGENIASR